MTLAQTPPETWERPGWAVAFASLYCLTFGPSAILVTGFGVFAGPIARSFGWSAGAISSAVPILSLMIMVLSPVQGWLVDRFGGRRLILWTIPTFALALAALSRLPNNLPLYYLAWIILPTAAIGVWPVSYLKVTSSWFERRLGLALGTANAGVGLGAVLVTPIAASVIAAYDWRTAFLVLAALALTALPIAWRFVRGNPAAVAAPAAMMRPAIDLRSVWRDPDYRLLLSGYFLIGITGTGLLTNMVPILLRLGLSPVGAVATMSLFGIASLIGRFLTGYLLDRFSARAVILGFIGASCAATLWFALGLRGVGTYVATIALGLLAGAEFDILAYAVRRYFGPQAFGRIFGTVFSAFQLGATGGAAVLAASLIYTDRYQAGLYVFAGALLIAIGLFTRLGSYRDI